MKLSNNMIASQFKWTSTCHHGNMIKIDNTPYIILELNNLISNKYSITQYQIYLILKWESPFQFP